MSASHIGRSHSVGAALRRPILIALAVSGLAGLGCASQSENFDDRDWTKEHGLQSAAGREVETLFADGESDVDRYNGALRGARHDLSLRSDAEPTTRCTCLDIAIGTPSDAKFNWSSKPPQIGPDSLVLAIRTQQAGCDAPDDGRPSIKAVDVSGEDVVVVIEELGWERPQVSGAVIPKPGPKGHLWVRPAKARRPLPYARSTSGPDRCRIATHAERHHQKFQSGRRY